MHKQDRPPEVAESRRRPVLLKLAAHCPQGHRNLDRVQPRVVLLYRHLDAGERVRRTKCPVCARIYWLRARAYQDATPVARERAFARAGGVR